MSADAKTSVYSLLADGTTIGIRPARPDDLDAVREMHEKMSPENLYLRFFSLSPRAAEREARRICREPGPDHPALLAFLDGRLIQNSKIAILSASAVAGMAGFLSLFRAKRSSAPNGR